MGKRVIDLIGQKFTRLTVVERDFSKTKRVHWICLCDCGKEKSVSSVHLKNGDTKSCGCYHIDRSTIHGESKTKLYSMFMQMNQRCHNENDSSYENYGGRGVSVCDEWRGGEKYNDFKSWALENGYSEGLSIDRINVNGNYEPSNCKWSTTEEQANNKRNNVIISINEQTKTISQWAKEYNLKGSVISDRIKLGWTGEDLLKPINLNMRKNGKIGVAGVYWVKKERRWYAYSNGGVNREYIGSFMTETEAIKAQEYYNNQITSIKEGEFN